MATHLNTDCAPLDKNTSSGACAFLAAGTGVEIYVCGEHMNTFAHLHMSLFVRFVPNCSCMSMLASRFPPTYIFISMLASRFPPAYIFISRRCYTSCPCSPFGSRLHTPAYMHFRIHHLAYAYIMFSCVYIHRSLLVHTYLCFRWLVFLDDHWARTSPRPTSTRQRRYWRQPC